MYKIVHHNDEDGIASAAVIHEYLCKIADKNEDDLQEEFYPVNYTDDLYELIGPIGTGDVVFFLDYSFGNEDNINYLLDLVKCGNDVTWIDHHKSSYELLEMLSNMEFDNNKNFHVRFNTAYCAAYGCYLYASEKLYPVNYTLSSNVPLYLKYVNSWDTWKFDEPNTKEFHYGMLAIDHDPKNTFKIVHTCGDGLIPYEINIFNQDDLCKEAEARFIEEVIRKGKDIVTYADNQNKELCKSYAFPLIIVDDTGEEKRIYTAIALNKLGNSTMFGDLLDEYDIAMPFMFNGDQYSYSLYTNKDNIDCSRLAKIIGTVDGLGGGGHKQAAGFQTLHNIINRNCRICITKKTKLFRLFSKNEYNISIIS